MQKPERSIEERADEVYRNAYSDVMPASWNRAQRRTAQGKALTAKAESPPAAPTPGATSGRRTYTH